MLFKSIVNHYFDKVYVLNLEKRTDRKLSMLQKLNRLGIAAEFVKAVNGYSPENIAEHQQYLNRPIGGDGSHPLEVEYKRKLIKSPGAWGCLKTFLFILKNAKKNNYQWILCFEDDVIFHKDFENRFKNATEKIPADWKLLYLGASQYVWKIPGGLRYPNKLKKKVDLKEPYYYPNATDGAFAIGIHCSVFDILISEIEKMNCPFDSGPLRSVIARFPKKCFVLTPNLAIADVSESDIRGQQNQAALARELKWNLGDYDFPFQKDLVSVIMPAFNAERTIEKAIRSMLLQTYNPLEIIVVDDASTDRTAKIVERMMLEDDRIRLVSLEENKGVGGARNAGLKASTGKIIAFQDADDVSLKNRIEKHLIPIYEKGVLFSVSQIIRSRCEQEALNIFQQEGMMRLVENRRKKNKKGEFDYRDQAVYGLAAIVYQRKIFEEFGLFEEHRFGEDMELLERIIFFKSGMKFHHKFNGHSLLNYRDDMPLIFQKINEVLLVCPALKETNLTAQFEKRKKENKNLQKKFREKYTSEGIGIFPKLASSTTNSHYIKGTDQTNLKENPIPPSSNSNRVPASFYSRMTNILREVLKPLN